MKFIKNGRLILKDRILTGKAIKDLDVRKRYGVNIIAISKAGSSDDFEIFTDPDRVLAPEETLVIIGGNEEIEKITGK